MDITTATYRGRTYVYVNNRVVALMERSPFTGEWCYGLSAHPTEPAISHWFRPPFTPTRRKTAKAAAKVVAAAL
jgi:hypothetical protein